jgi:RimJ/RimL family protein N-acetyltransferase
MLLLLVFRSLQRRSQELRGVYCTQAMCDIDNVASARVLEKLGMQLEGTIRRYAMR